MPFVPGRTDASSQQTDEGSFAVMEPKADGFRNYSKAQFECAQDELLVDKAQLLGLTAPEMTVLVGGMRVLNANFNSGSLGVLTDSPEVLTNDFFVNLLDMGTAWKPLSDERVLFEGTDRNTGEKKWIASKADLIFGSNSELKSNRRSICR